VQGREQDVDLIVLSTTSVSIPEGGTASFEVWLADAPAGQVTVGVQWYSGDPYMRVESGDALVFDSTNYAVPQTVTLVSFDDVGVFPGVTNFIVSAPNYVPKFVAATRVENDPSLVVIPTYLPVPEGGVNSFTVTFTLPPASPTPITVVRLGGDTDISVLSGASVVFAGSFHGPHTVVLAAAEDAGASNGIATFRVDAGDVGSALVTAVEIDND
jgi:hypothetical protein